GRRPGRPRDALSPPPRRRAAGLGNGAGAASGAPPRPAPRPMPAARPRPPRSTGRRGPNHALRRSIALAIVLTLVVLGGFGAYVAYDKVRGDDTAAVQDGTGYANSVQTAMS